MKYESSFINTILVKNKINVVQDSTASLIAFIYSSKFFSKLVEGPNKVFTFCTMINNVSTTAL